ncbi:glycosyltransferase [Deinococcus peraridilitoris]|uniref:Glycosyltransferase n=1 Tax=Deinococcus peraridilitoris (strain DSM 19664 / LMG 22246 / CIP 109416 / KR-200) TaxID=937777 RepID=L0A4A1_DEIPD|nr:glycosyltransferase [Deinococcus peraridilitoris]AFZ68259.1 glycosyltransferase [Deinococcus peraridilitoris DSM 19664]
MNSSSQAPSRIAFFVDSLPMGGAEVVSLALVQGFVERGLAVDLVLGVRSGDLQDRIPPGVRVVELAGPLTPREVTFREETLRMVTSVPALARYLRRERPAVLIAAKSHANVTAIAAKRLSRSPTPVFITEHTYLTGELPSQEVARGTPKNRILRRTYPLANRIVTVSRGAADDLSAVAGIPRERIDVVYNPVILPGLPEKADAPIDHPWFRAGEPPVILGSGRFTTQKDFPTLVRAFAHLRAQREARLMILGDGPERAKVEALIAQLGLQDSAACIGFVSNPYPYLKNAAVFAYSSVWESFGLVLIEALALGTPVASTACGAPQEILQEGRLGRLAPVGNPEALAQALLVTLQEPSPTVTEQDLRPFTLDAVVQDYLDLMGVASPVTGELRSGRAPKVVGM